MDEMELMMMKSKEQAIEYLEKRYIELMKEVGIVSFLLGLLGCDLPENE